MSCGQCNVQSFGFFELYAIDNNRPHHDADSRRGKSYGLNSPHGRRGAICAHFGWTYDYLLRGIAWGLVQRMMVDAPGYDYNADDDDTVIDLTQNKNTQQVMDFINSMM